MMIDREIVRGLLSTTSSKNLVGIGMELKPYELALHMLQALNNSEEYGYVVMGVAKLLDCYTIDGVSHTIIHSIKEPLETELKLISVEIEMECGNISIDGCNIFVIMLKNSVEILSLEFSKDGSQEAFIKKFSQSLPKPTSKETLFRFK